MPRLVPFRLISLCLVQSCRTPFAHSKPRRLTYLILSRLGFFAASSHSVCFSQHDQRSITHIVCLHDVSVKKHQGASGIRYVPTGEACLPPDLVRLGLGSGPPHSLCGDETPRSAISGSQNNIRVHGFIYSGIGSWIYTHFIQFVRHTPAFFLLFFSHVCVFDILSFLPFFVLYMHMICSLVEPSLHFVSDMLLFGCAFLVSVALFTFFASLDTPFLSTQSLSFS